MLWDCFFSVSGTGKLHKVDEMEKKDYLQMLQLHLKPTAGWLKLGHTLKLDVERLKQVNIQFLVHPFQSPDLNPIENMRTTPKAGCVPGNQPS